MSETPLAVNLSDGLIQIGFGLLIPVLLIPILWVMLALTTITAIQRFVKVWRQATNVMPDAQLGRAQRRRRRVRAEARERRQLSRRRQR